MPSNNDYYNLHARKFFDATVSVDMSALYAAFLAKLPRGAAILDAGCGSGRDAKAFVDRGYAVTAFDASPELAKLASALCGFEVATRGFRDVREVAAYDGIWCCASLLHVSPGDMGVVLGTLWRALRSGGCFYLSFKCGSGERERAGRVFTDADEATVRGWLEGLPGAHGAEVWETQDSRPERTDRWLNVLVSKK